MEKDKGEDCCHNPDQPLDLKSATIFEAMKTDQQEEPARSLVSDYTGTKIFHPTDLPFDFTIDFCEQLIRRNLNRTSTRKRGQALLLLQQKGSNLGGTTA